MTPFEKWWTSRGPKGYEAGPMVKEAFEAGAASRDADVQKLKQAVEHWSDIAVTLSTGEEVYLLEDVEQARNEEREACAIAAENAGAPYAKRIDGKLNQNMNADIQHGADLASDAIRARGA